MDKPPIQVDDPPLQAADLLAQSLAEQLTLHPKGEATKWGKETSEPKVKNDDTEQSYQQRCEQVLAKFKPRLAERLRMGIPDTEYWEREARHYKDAAIQQIWQNALNKYSQGHTPGTADAWRSIAKFYQGVLIDHGLPVQKAKDVRLSIDAEKYWQAEAQYYQRRLNPNEGEKRQNYGKGKWKINKKNEPRVKRRTEWMPSVARSRAQLPYARPPPPSERVSSWTRPRAMDSTGAGVTKHKRDRARVCSSMPASTLFQGLGRLGATPQDG